MSCSFPPLILFAFLFFLFSESLCSELLHENSASSHALTLLQSLHVNSSILAWQPDQVAFGRIIATADVPQNTLLFSLNVKGQIFTEDHADALFVKLLSKHGFSRDRQQELDEKVELIHKYSVLLCHLRQYLREKDLAEPVGAQFLPYVQYLQHLTVPEYFLDDSLLSSLQTFSLRSEITLRWEQVQQDFLNFQTLFDWISLTDWQWAMHIVWSRLHMIYDEQWRERIAALVPVGDLLNYAQPGEENVYSMTNRENNLEFFAKRTILKGEEMTVAYSRQITNRKLLLEYGFCILNTSEAFLSTYEEVVVDFAFLLAEKLSEDTPGAKWKAQRIQSEGLYGVPLKVSLRWNSDIARVDKKWLSLMRILLAENEDDPILGTESPLNDALLLKLADVIESRITSADEDSELLESQQSNAMPHFERCFLLLRLNEKRILKRFTTQLKKAASSVDDEDNQQTISARDEL